MIHLCRCGKRLVEATPEGGAPELFEFVDLVRIGPGKWQIENGVARPAVAGTSDDYARGFFVRHEPRCDARQGALL